MAKGTKTGGRDFKKGVSGNPKGRPKKTEKWDTSNPPRASYEDFMFLLRQYDQKNFDKFKYLLEKMIKLEERLKKGGI